MNSIEFIPLNKDAELLIPHPKPAKMYIPQWFKDIPAVNSKNIKISKSGNSDINLKNCVPFLDSLSSGYIQETWTDISIQKDEDGDVIYNQSSTISQEIMKHREESFVKTDGSFYEFEFLWNQLWVPKLPKGYSYLFTHPLGRIDLPFYTMTAIVDGDSLNYSIGGNVPFYIRKDFSGIIPEGTPMYQMIPFKRENWKMVINNFNEDLSKKGINELRKRFVGSYKKVHWKKKTFE